MMGMHGRVNRRRGDGVHPHAIGSDILGSSAA